MVKLYAKMDDLMTFSKFLEEKANELDDIAEKVKTTVEGFSPSTWSGVDYENFLGRCTVYTETLKSISKNLVKLSDFIVGKTQKYDKTSSQFMENIQIRRINYGEQDTNRLG